MLRSVMVMVLGTVVALSGCGPIIDAMQVATDPPAVSACVTQQSDRYAEGAAMRGVTRDDLARDYQHAQRMREWDATCRAAASQQAK